VPGHVDGDELAARAILGQQVSVLGARTIAGRLVARYGKPLTTPAGGVTHLFPDAATLADADPADLPMPASRKRALSAMTTALANGDVVIDAGASRADVEQQLLALPGIGPWTTAYVRLRALSDPDVFMPTDLGVRKALENLGKPADPKSAAALAEDWRPWRSYALIHLWESL
jgi:AraC family transcriptional regulator of adaptative response / DNA-3-methyladenine glycosylase II